MAQTRSESHGTQADSAARQHSEQRATEPDHTELDAFVGKWHMEGQQLAGSTTRAAPVSALQTYEWMPGGKFLVHRFDGNIGDARASCVEIIGFDAERKCYRAHTFYNNGQMNVWDITCRDDRWLARGDWNAGERTLKIRCTTTFADAGKTMHGKWEQSADGVTWQPFWEVAAKKIVAS
jgi:Protein of unknown function (DUF1579)